MIKELKNIDHEIQRLLEIEQTVESFNVARKNTNVTLLPVSQDFYNKLASENKLINDIFYCIFEKDIGQYINGYIE